MKWFSVVFEKINRVFFAYIEHIRFYINPPLQNHTIYVYKSVTRDISNVHSILQVVEWSGYEAIREKTVCEKKINVGINFINNLLKKNDFSKFFKILILTDFHISNKTLSHFDPENYDLILGVNNDFQDMGAHKKAALYLTEHYPELCMNKDIAYYLINSSLRAIDYGRLIRLGQIAIECDALCGIGLGFGPRNSIFKKIHLQSYFLVGRAGSLTRILIEMNACYKEKLNIIKYGEVYISNQWLLSGMPLVADIIGRLIIIDSVLHRLVSKDSRSYLSSDLINTL